MLKRPPNTRSDNDLPRGWQRLDDRTWMSPGGWHWQHLRRHEVDDLTDEQWGKALLILRRPPTGWHPCGSEGTFLGNVMHQCSDFGPMSMTTVVLVVRYFADGEEREYITRAVKDKRAHLALLVPVQR